MRESLARAQRSMGDPHISYPLCPPMLDGCPETSSDAVQYPLQIDYDYERVDESLFAQEPLPGIER